MSHASPPSPSLPPSTAPPARQIVVSLTPWERELLVMATRSALSVARSNATDDEHGVAPHGTVLVGMHERLLAKLDGRAISNG